MPSTAPPLERRELQASEPDRERWNRSPFPYNRSKEELSHSMYISSTAARRHEDGRPKAITPSQEGNSPADGFDSDRRKRTKLATSPSDSGTEADDERHLLRALTAPPTRPRKGLRVPGESGTSASPSPLLTPANLDEELASYLRRPSVQPEKTDTTREVAEKARKLKSRRRFVVLRRVLETWSLGVIGWISMRGASVDYFKEACLHLLVIWTIYCTCLLLTISKPALATSRLVWSTNLKVPVSADPAPFLYPVFIPIIVAISAVSENPPIILANFMLSICAIPTKAIPLQDYNVQWMLSLLPMTYCAWEAKGALADDYRPVIGADDLNYFALLPPLYHALTPSLRFMTTSSLLSSELHLLSTALINLLFFANSPQSLILKALLWIGGLTLLVTCKEVLKYTVSLARVPSWRFRKVNHDIFKKKPILRMIDGILGGWLSYKLEATVDNENSDSEVEEFRPMSRVQTVDLGARDSVRVRSGKEKDSKNDSQMNVLLQSLRKRRHTLPTTPSALPDLHQIRKTAKMGLERLRNRPKSFLALTSAQAGVLKWLCAGYTYTVIVTTILLPMRMYIGWYCLNGWEPIGWALGYLFGALPSLRMNVILWRLDNWIPLPAFMADAQAASLLPAASNLRLLITAHILSVLCFGLLLVHFVAPHAEVDTRRKLFHGMMVTMFLPTTPLDPCFIALALSLVLAVFLLLDICRASQLPPLGRPLTLFLAPFVDGRDHRGPVVVSHIFLLIGCAIPLWLELTTTPRGGEGALEGWTAHTRGVGMVAGIVCVGMGDAAASLVGRRYGRRRWPWGGGKSIEGSVAFAVAVVLGLMMTRAWMGTIGWSQGKQVHSVGGGSEWGVWLKLLLAASGASFTEAVLTGANDNVLVPVVLWVLVKGLEL